MCLQEHKRTQTISKRCVHHKPPRGFSANSTYNKQRPCRDSATKEGGGISLSAYSNTYISRHNTSLLRGISPTHFNSFLPYILCGKFLLSPRPQKDRCTAYHAKCITAVLSPYVHSVCGTQCCGSQTTLTCLL